MTMPLSRQDLLLALLCTATFLQNREIPTVSRHWHSVSKPIQKLATGLHHVMSEGMPPHEIYYVLATDEEFSVSARKCNEVAHWTEYVSSRRPEARGSRSG
jgi:hypothetical protein